MNKLASKPQIYKVEREQGCNCHPETCCCGPLGWHVTEKDKPYVWAFTQNKADHIAKVLNQFDKLRQGLESVIFVAENEDSCSFEEILQDIASKAKEALT